MTHSKTRFDGWRIDGYTATSPDSKYSLWIANGFLSFYDHEPHFPRQTLLKSIGLWQRYKIWRELRREQRLRASDFLGD